MTTIYEIYREKRRRRRRRWNNARDVLSVCLYWTVSPCSLSLSVCSSTSVNDKWATAAPPISDCHSASTKEQVCDICPAAEEGIFSNNDASSKYLMAPMPHNSSSQILMGSRREIKMIMMSAEGQHRGFFVPLFENAVKTRRHRWHFIRYEANTHSHMPAQEKSVCFCCWSMLSRVNQFKRNHRNWKI